MSSVSEVFGSMVFSDIAMQQRLPREAYRAVQDAIYRGKRLTPAVADVVASAMKDWAIEKGATHYTHWFQPMTGITAEKHESFLSPTGGGRAIMEFSGKELIHGEPDASSFPSGGLRATFEARGYTAWDPTSYAFVKDGVLCIPTAFCSYGAEALDEKTPLLRSMQALNREAVRLLRCFGDTATEAVNACVGPEQEYFLIDRAVYEQRKDLIYCGRTLFGARPPKGQELETHYFGSIKPRVSAFMKELNAELWKLGIFAKTEHNEVAPAQHELAPIFTTVNLAADQNQLTMEMMQRIAAKHDMVCLLAEKPFDGINGSGKHNNWSISTDGGENLLEPGDTPAGNARFLTFLCAVIRAVDEHQDLLRCAVASAGNDHRLGANEAPPAIVSIYLGDQLTAVLDSIEHEEEYHEEEREQFKVGVHALPRFPKDVTDRNRTSPFAFTGNKFEFRMVGSSASISDANIVLNTIVADTLSKFSDELEGADDFDSALRELLIRTIREHKRILFNGNGYDESWVKEAEKRGLLNLRTTPEAASALIDPANMALFARQRVFSDIELRARHEIKLDTYCKVLRIEALTMCDMANREILPEVSRFVGELSETAARRSHVCSGADCAYETDTIAKISSLLGEAHRATIALNGAVEHSDALACSVERAAYCCNDLLPLMGRLRAAVDSMELLSDEAHWPHPTIGDIVFSVK